MAADLEFFKRLYLCSLTSYGLITGLADFSFTERCYRYLQSALNPCLKAAPLSVEKPDFPDFLNNNNNNNKVLQDKTRENKHESGIKLKKEEIVLKEGKSWSSPQRDKQTNININEH